MTQLTTSQMMTTKMKSVQLAADQAKVCTTGPLATDARGKALNQLKGQTMTTRPELTFEEFCSKPMEMVMHISGEKEHYLHRFNRETGVNRVTVTPLKKNGEFGKPSTIYYISDDPNNYTAPDQIYLAYMMKVCGVTA